ELGATAATRQRVNGGAALTLQEREVAQLAATGMTNREIAAKLYVSPRTVGSPVPDLPQARHLLPGGAARCVERGARGRGALAVAPTYGRRGQSDDSHLADVTARCVAHRVVVEQATTRGAGHDPLSGPVGGRDRRVVGFGPRARRRTRGPG